MVSGFDFDLSKKSHFNESCTKEKIHCLPFQRSSSKRAKQPFELTHSDVCGKVGSQSLGGGEYFVIFVHNHTRYMWVYILKRKDKVLACFCEWKAFIESTDRKVMTLCTDNGGEYTSTHYLTSQGIKHELAIPQIPQ